MDWLKLKNFLVVRKLTPAEFTSAQLVPAIVEDFQQLIRLNRLLEETLAYWWQIAAAMASSAGSPRFKSHRAYRRLQARLLEHGKLGMA